MPHPHPSLPHPPPARRGSVLIYSMLAMVGLLAAGMLAVDLGRVQLVKSELRAAADAAAWAGAANIYEPQGTAAAKAVAVAGMNTADGRAVALVTTGADPDVVLGRS